MSVLNRHTLLKTTARTRWTFFFLRPKVRPGNASISQALVTGRVLRRTLTAVPVPTTTVSTGRRPVALMYNPGIAPSSTNHPRWALWMCLALNNAVSQSIEIHQSINLSISSNWKASHLFFCSFFSFLLLARAAFTLLCAKRAKLARNHHHHQQQQQIFAENRRRTTKTEWTVDAFLFYFLFFLWWCGKVCLLYFSMHQRSAYTVVQHRDFKDDAWVGCRGDVIECWFLQFAQMSIKDEALAVTWSFFISV